MENTIKYEKTRKILEDNINRILNERNKSMAWLSREIGTNDRYIARFQRKELVPSLQVICKIAEVLRVSVAELFTEKEG
ncbi:MAG: helix-turn-helix transcriptional regulator [Oscillospiraceae bacterium]|nr:helix-turn-helix transcriptional regulator [Oscillospiraceae bacterium]